MSAAPREVEVLGEAEQTSSEKPQPAPAPSRLGALKHPRVRRVLLGVVAALAAGAVVWWFRYRPYVTTEDARVAAPTVSVAADGVGGRVLKVLVREGDRVQAGQALIELDSSRR